MPCFQALHPIPPSSSPPDGESLFCNVPHFRAHQPVPPSSSPPESESSFPACHVSELTNLLLLFLPSRKGVLFFLLPFFPCSPTPPSPFLPSGSFLLLFLLLLFPSSPSPPFISR